MIRTLALLLSLFPAAAGATCYADYKAKRDGPLKLAYGVMELADCADRARVEAEVRARLEAAGWTLLALVGTFGAEGLEARKADAGAHFLAF